MLESRNGDSCLLHGRFGAKPLRWRDDQLSSRPDPASFGTPVGPSHARLAAVALSHGSHCRVSRGKVLRG